MDRRGRHRGIRASGIGAVRRRRFLGALGALLAAGAAAAQQRLNTAMHASACERLATLAERLAKCQLQVAQGVLAARSRRMLRDSEREFEALLPLAAGLAADAEARESFTLLRVLWKEMRPWTRKSATRENARQLSERAEEVSWVASKAARLLKTESTPQREALGAMQAATLAQRVGRLALLRRMSSEARHASELADATARLGSTIDTLAGSPHTIDLEDDLQMAGAQYGFLLDALRESAAEGGGSAAELVAKTCDNVTDSLERASRLYENGSI